jgi:hypothetical protein
MRTAAIEAERINVDARVVHKVSEFRSEFRVCITPRALHLGDEPDVLTRAFESAIVVLI